MLPYMAPVRTNTEIERVAKKTIEGLYGSEIKNFKVRVVFPFPNERKRESWDVQVTFLLNSLQYTVDLIIEEKSGHVTNARLIDTMAPL